MLRPKRPERSAVRIGGKIARNGVRSGAPVVRSGATRAAKVARSDVIRAQAPLDRGHRALQDQEAQAKRHVSKTFAKVCLVDDSATALK
jgi:hypothetical protein